MTICSQWLWILEKSFVFQIRVLDWWNRCPAYRGPSNVYDVPLLDHQPQHWSFQPTDCLLDRQFGVLNDLASLKKIYLETMIFITFDDINIQAKKRQSIKTCYICFKAVSQITGGFTRCPAPKHFLNLGRVPHSLSGGETEHSHQPVGGAFALGHPVKTLVALKDAEGARFKL